VKILDNQDLKSLKNQGTSCFSTPAEVPRSLVGLFHSSGEAGERNELVSSTKIPGDAPGANSRGGEMTIPSAASSMARLDTRLRGGGGMVS